MVDLKERNEQRRKLYEQKSDRALMKRVVKGDQELRQPYANLAKVYGGNYSDKTSTELTITMALSDADKRIKDASIGVMPEYALKDLEYASHFVDKYSNEHPEDADSVKRYASAIQKRAYRLSNKLADNPKLDEKAIALVERMEKKYGVRPHSALERAAATTSIITIFGGLFFLSPNITGNAISNMTSKTSSGIGAILIILGIVLGIFWLKNRKTKNKENKVIVKKKVSKKSKSKKK